MTIYAGVDEQGFVVVQQGFPDPGDVGPPSPVPDGPYAYYPLAEIVPGSLRPTPTSLLMWVDGAAAWVDVRTLDEAKAEKNAEINQKRLAANRTSFVFAGKDIACDELSMLDIQSLNGIVALIGDLPSSFANQWKAIDNTYVAIPDKAAWIAFIGAMVATGQANFDHSQALKATLAEATTNADVDAITWE